MEECAKALEVMYCLDLDDQLLEHFTTLSILKEKSAKKVAMRMKSMWHDYEIFPITLYYTSLDAKAQEKKILANFHDCILQLFNQVNRIKYSKNQELEADLDENEGRSQPLTNDINATTMYQSMKGRNFSLYYTNAYLYYNIYRYLFERNINKLSQLFSTAAVQELHIELSQKTNEELRSTHITTFIMLWRLLSVQGNFQDLQNALFRYILFKSPASVSEAMIHLSFVYRENQAQENIASHIDFIVNFMKIQKLEREDDQADQEKIVDYILEVTSKKKFVEFKSFLPEYRDFLNSSIDIPDSNKTPFSRVCLTKFLGEYFPDNDLGYLASKMAPHEDKFFEDYVEVLLKTWMERTKSKTSELEETITEPEGIKSLSEDLYSFMSSNVASIEREHASDEQAMNSQMPKFNFKSYQQTKSDLVDYSHMRDFIQTIKATKNIRVFQSKELLINLTENIAPDYLALDNISAYEGYLQANNQRCVVFRVDIQYVDHLDRIKKNLDIMNMYSPLVIKYLGIYIPTEVDSEQYTLYFVTDWWFQNLNDYIKILYQEPPKECPEDLFVMIYRMLYFMKSASLTAVLIPLVSPFNIFIGKNGYPQFLIPFFSAAYYCPKPYYNSIFSKADMKVAVSHYFAYPSYESLPDLSTILLGIRAGGNKLGNLKLSDRDNQYMQTCQVYCFVRLVLYLLSGQVPNFQTKPCTMSQLLAILKNDVKSLPNLQKQCALIKKKTAPRFKGLIDMISALLIKPDPNGLKILLEKMITEIPDTFQIKSNLQYQIDTLNSAVFIEGTEGGLLGVPLRRIILLPCKLLFNGYLEDRIIESGRFYQSNNLLVALNLQDKENGVYFIDCFLDEKRTLNLKMTESKLESCTYFVKSNPDAVSADVSNQERTMNFDQFYPNSWVHTEAFWTKTIQPYVRSDVEEGTLA